jgi:hypothetical protein
MDEQNQMESPPRPKNGVDLILDPLSPTLTANGCLFQAGKRRRRSL